MTNRYAPWTLTGSVLTFPVADSYEYDIDLGEIVTPAEALDSLFHLAEKNWGPAALPGFVRALAECTDIRSRTLELRRLAPRG